MSSVEDNHKRWNAAAGFHGGRVYAITQTSDGYLWIGTGNGLLRFDGLTFEAIRPDQSESPENPSIVGVTTDADGRLWASNGVQMLSYLDGHLKVGLPGSGRQPNQDIAIAKAQNGALLFAAGLGGIFSFQHGKTELLAARSDLPGIPLSLAQAANGKLWIGARTGLFLSEPGAPSIRPIGALPDVAVNCLLPTQREGLLIGTDKGLWSWDGSSVKQTDVPAALKGRQILALASDLDGNIWIASEFGLFKADGSRINSGLNSQWQLKSTASVPVTTLYVDREGNMWAGGITGLESYRANAFATYSVSTSSRPENGGPIYADLQSRIWFAPSGGGLFWFRQNHLESIESAGLKTDGVYSIAGGDGEVWVGRKHGGLTRLRVNRSSIGTLTYTRQSGLAEDSVYAVYRSRDGTVWAGTLNQGLSRLRHGVLKSFTTADGLPSNTISAIAESSSGAIFVGTPNGLGELRNDKWIAFTAREGLPPGAVDCLYFDDSDTLWIGTTKGIAFLRSGTIHVPSKVPDPLSGEVLGIAQSGGWLWISTPDHVLRVSREALRKGSLEESGYREYGDAEGLASVEGVKRSQSVVRDEHGEVWFSLNRGISVVQPSILARQSARPLIHLERMIADEGTIALGNDIRVAPGRHRITFRFVSVSLSNPDQTRYRYRLDDYDSAWSEPSAIQEANYTNLAPGNYRFRVMARNADGLWSGQQAAVSFAVEPAYWQTLWFQLTCFAGLCVLASGLYRLRLIQLTRRLNVRFEERLAERARIGRELHDTLLQNLTGLALQISGVAKIVKEPARAVEGLQQLKRQAEDCVRETRQSVWNIRSAGEDIQDLPSALKHSGQQLTAGGAIRFTFVCEGAVRELPPTVRQDLLRIANEAVGNAVRHAAASEIRTTLNFGLRDVQLTVSDDGLGFDFADKEQLPGHFGLTTMRERARQIGARIHIASTLAKGTSISVRVPGKVIKH